MKDIFLQIGQYGYQKGVEKAGKFKYARLFGLTSTGNVFGARLGSDADNTLEKNVCN